MKSYHILKSKVSGPLPKNVGEKPQTTISLKIGITYWRWTFSPPPTGITAPLVASLLGQKVLAYKSTEVLNLYHNIIICTQNNKLTWTSQNTMRMPLCSASPIMLLIPWNKRFNQDDILEKSPLGTTHTINTSKQILNEFEFSEFIVKTVDPYPLWRDKVTNNAVLERAGILTMFTLSNRAAWDGWAMSAAWKTDASPRTFSMVSWWQGRGRPDACNCGTRTSASATSKLWHQHQHLGNSRRRQVHLETGSEEGSLSVWREPDAAGRGEKGHAGRHSSMLTDRWPPSPAQSATENATLASVFSATPDDTETDENSAAQNSTVSWDRRKPTADIDSGTPQLWLIITALCSGHTWVHLQQSVTRNLMLHAQCRHVHVNWSSPAPIYASCQGWQLWVFPLSALCWWPCSLRIRWPGRTGPGMAEWPPRSAGLWSEHKESKRFEWIESNNYTTEYMEINTTE